MQKLFLSLSFILALVVTSRAEIVVYKLAQPVRQIGASSDSKFTAVGYAVLDYDTAEYQEIFGYKLPSGKVYEVQALEVDFFNVWGPNGKTFTGYRLHVASTNSEAFAFGYGQDTSLPITPIRSVTLPRCFKGKAQSVLFDGAGNGTVIDSAITLTFAQKDTQEFNGNFMSVSSAIHLLETRLLGMGYFRK